MSNVLQFGNELDTHPADFLPTIVLYFMEASNQLTSWRKLDKLNSDFFLFAAYIQNSHKLLQKAEVNYSKYYCLHLIFLVGLKWATKAKDQPE